MLRRRIKVGVRVWQQAEHIWEILAGFVMFGGGTSEKPATITYGELAQRMGYPTPAAGHTLARPLELVGRMCLKTGLPPLNVVVVSKQTGAPGAEVLLRPGSTVEADQTSVMEVDWYSWCAPSAGTFRALWEAKQEKQQAA